MTETLQRYARAFVDTAEMRHISLYVGLAFVIMWLWMLTLLVFKASGEPTADMGGEDCGYPDRWQSYLDGHWRHD